MEGASLHLQSLTKTRNGNGKAQIKNMQLLHYLLFWCMYNIVFQKQTRLYVKNLDTSEVPFMSGGEEFSLPFPGEGKYPKTDDRSCPRVELPAVCWVFSLYYLFRHKSYKNIHGVQRYVCIAYLFTFTPVKGCKNYSAGKSAQAGSMPSWSLNSKKKKTLVYLCNRNFLVQLQSWENKKKVQHF